jgi:hypothetical protein
LAESNKTAENNTQRAKNLLIMVESLNVWNYKVKAIPANAPLLLS